MRFARVQKHAGVENLLRRERVSDNRKENGDTEAAGILASLSVLLVNLAGRWSKARTGRAFPLSSALRSAIRRFADLGL
jgi:hypothetical protein